MTPLFSPYHSLFVSGEAAAATESGMAGLMSAAATPSCVAVPTNATTPFRLPPPPPALANLPETSVWLEMGRLASLTDAVNLGQGFPDWSPPNFLVNAAEQPSDALDPLRHQYARPRGDLSLVETIAQQYSPRIFPPRLEQLGSAPAKKARTINPVSEVLVTVGASHALSLAISAIVGPGDEALLIEPAFDLYTGAVLVAGAKPVYVPLRMQPKPEIGDSDQFSCSSEFTLDMDELNAAISPRTRLLVLNSPHNPTGKVFSRDELTAIAKVVEKHPSLVVVSDEVYEHMTYNPELPHLSFASLSEDCFERSITIFSVGKTFSATGWKIGWIVAPSKIVARLHALHQFSVFSVATTLQRAVASALVAAEKPHEGYPTYYDWLAAHYKRKRDKFLDVIGSCPGLKPVVPDGAFYVMVRHTPADSPASRSAPPPQVAALLRNGELEIDPITENRSDYNFCRRLAIDVGVVGIPPSAFCGADHSEVDVAANFVRFAFCKEDAVLEEVRRRLCTNSLKDVVE